MGDFSEKIIEANSQIPNWRLKNIESVKIIEEAEDFIEYRVVYTEICQGISGRDFEDIKIMKTEVS